jgi:pimeloyl-ACP methyl ester carboxylesterase
MNSTVDIRHIAGSVNVPTLVLHRLGDRDAPIEGSRWLADHIPNAHLVEFDGNDHLPWVNSDEILESIRSFIADLPSTPNTRS